MTVLILGGTGEALQTTRRLEQQGLDLIYSVAGRVRQPQLLSQVVSGGFSAQGGLLSFIRSRGIRSIVDMTHPFAAQISTTAAEVAAQAGIPCWHYIRPVWQPEQGDQWQEFGSWPELLAACMPFRRVFFTSGQLPQEHWLQLEALHRSGQQHDLRTAVPAPPGLPAHIRSHCSIGPFSVTAEQQWFRRLQPDLLVCKHSGGDAVEAKLQVAAEWGIPVFMLARPELKLPPACCFSDPQQIDELLQTVRIND